MKRRDVDSKHDVCSMPSVVALVIELPIIGHKAHNRLRYSFLLKRDEHDDIDTLI